jgi:hypothetical protein
MFFQDIRNLIGYHIAFVTTIAQTLHKRLHKDDLLLPPKT